MKKALYLLSALLVSAAIPALAQSQTPMTTSVPAPAAQPSALPATDPVMEQVSALQGEWARIKYQVPDDDEQLKAIHTLEERAAGVTASNPARPEPKIWEAIILSTDAGIVKGISALPKVEKAKELLEESQKIDPTALQGSADTSLGSLYYQVPGWPVAFGDDEKAEKHLQTALKINPEGIDPNYFYGDFLLQDGRIDLAKTYLTRALNASARPGRALADAGRRQEVKAALAKADQELLKKKSALN
jgi:tetratricopeptide (TPR) repeat protein